MTCLPVDLEKMEGEVSHSQVVDAEGVKWLYVYSVLLCVFVVQLNIVNQCPSLPDCAVKM